MGGQDGDSEKDVLVKDSKQLAHSGCAAMLPFTLTLLLGVPLWLGVLLPLALLQELLGLRLRLLAIHRRQLLCLLGEAIVVAPRSKLASRPAGGRRRAPLPDSVEGGLEVRLPGARRCELGLVHAHFGPVALHGVAAAAELLLGELLALRGDGECLAGVGLRFPPLVVQPRHLRLHLGLRHLPLHGRSTPYCEQMRAAKHCA